jgi:predicted metal-dependent phosphotriesterase family hydrolase
MIGTCLQAGISAADVTKMVRNNPERLLARSRTLNPTEALVG